MQNTLIVIIMLLIPGFAYAQSNVEKDKIYLKNGTIIKGIIVEEVPDKTISIIQTAPSGKDSIYIYKADNVAMVVKATTGSKSKSGRRNSIKEGSQSSTVQPRSSAPTQSNNPQMKQNKDFDISQTIKESIKENRLEPAYTNTPVPNEYDTKNIVTEGKTGGVGEVFDPFSPIPTKPRKQWNRGIRGFRAFWDQAITLGIGDKRNNRWNSSTSLGVQFNPIFYLGVGISYDMTLNDKEGSVPIFINPRINFLDENITPFLDIRAGWSFLEGKGFYASPTAGVSFARGTSAYNIGIGYSFQRAKYKYRPDKATMETTTVFDNYHGLFLRLTFEFNLYRF